MNFKPEIVIVHCSDTPDYPKEDPKFDLFGAEEIDIWHKQRKWVGIGYHWVIRRTGVIEVGRPETQMGAHTKGHNNDSIAICYVGTQVITVDQIAALNMLYGQIKDRHGITVDNWFTHNHFNPYKICPGFSMDDLKAMLVKGVEGGVREHQGC
jgi:N-acetylmuramoyl-L-alanine amidase